MVLTEASLHAKYHCITLQKHWLPGSTVVHAMCGAIPYSKTLMNSDEEDAAQHL